MAVFSTGNFSYGSGGVARLDLQVDDPPAVDYNTTQVALGVRLYVITNGSLTDNSGGSSYLAYDGNVFHSQGITLSHAAFPTGGATLVAASTFTVGLIRATPQAFTMSGGINGIEGLGGSRSVSGIIGIPARPYGPPAQVNGFNYVNNITADGADFSWNGVDNGGDPTAVWDLQLATDAGFGNVVVSNVYTGAPIRIGGLTRATTYYARVRQRNTVYAGPFSGTHAFITLPLPPGAPTQGNISAIGQTGLTVNWTAPADNGGAAVNLYTVQYAEDSLFTVNAKTVSSAAGSTSKAITGLDPGKSYFTRVRGTNSAGAGGWSLTKTAVTLTGFHYGVGGVWVDVKVHYGVAGAWVDVTPRYGAGGVWVP